MRKEVDIIKEKLDLADFLRSYIQLSPAGRNLKGLCPFHGEKTPSFIVSPDKKIWHCFGCGEGGDILSFVMKYEHVEFPEALRMLAERAGIPMRNISPTQEREFGVLYDMHEVAGEFFSAMLEKNVLAKKYLLARGLTEETMKEFRIGYNPMGDSLTLHLMQKHFDLRDISRAGLVGKVRGMNRDRFEGRIIFPLFNTFGKIVGFAGRILETEGVKTDDGAKYLNSPETPIFNKSKTLYGLHRSKSFIAENRTVFLVEGYMDFLMSWQTGVKNAIAISGTALTEHHLERLRRFADSALVSFDNDPAGFRALERGMDMFHAFDFHVKAVTLGEYKDPAEACEKNPETFLTAVNTAKPAFEYLFNRYFSENKPLDIAMKKRVVTHLIDRIAKMKSGVEQGIWAKELAKKAEIGELVIMEDLATTKKGNTPKKVSETVKIIPEKDGIIDKRAEHLLILGFAHPDFWAIMSEKKELFPERFRVLLDSPEDERNELLRMRAAYESQNKTKKELDAEFNEMMGYLELSQLQKKQESLKQDMRNAKDEETAMRLTQEFSTISRRLHEIKRPRTIT